MQTNAAGKPATRWKTGDELRRATAALSGPDLLDPHSPDGVDSKESTQAPSMSSDYKVPVPIPEDAEPAVRELASLAQRYGQSASQDFEAVYNHGLALQELATRLDTSKSNQMTLLSQASERYEAATRLRPASHAALYNWGVALSDMARVVRGSDRAAAAGYLMAAADKYSLSLHLNAANPQALNNWGLVLQELAAMRPPAERAALVALSADKFRRAMALRPDFDRACYNLGTVVYAHACQMQSSTQQHLSSALTQDASDAEREAAEEAAVQAAFGLAAQYIVLAGMLQPGREVYRRSLGVVQPLLPLPYLRRGFLQASSPPGPSIEERWAVAHFVADQDSFRTAPSASIAGPAPDQAAAASTSSIPENCIDLKDIVAVRRCSDTSLPRGYAFWLALASRPSGQYFVADTEEDAQAWVDVLSILQHLTGLEQQESIAKCLQPGPSQPQSVRLPADLPVDLVCVSQLSGHRLIHA